MSVFQKVAFLPARALDASQHYASPGPDRLDSIAESFSVQTHSTCTEMTALGRGFLPFRWSPGKCGNPTRSGRRELMIGGRARAFRGFHGWVALARHVEGNP
jgi:hypothetical protein